MMGAINLVVLILLVSRVSAQITEEKLTASDAASSDFFGRSVALNGDYAIVGANGDDDNGSQSGSAYIFKAQTTGWVEQTKLTPSDGAERDSFGHSVSIFGDYVIVGAYRDDDNGFQSGSAYIFKREGANWIEQTKLLASDGAENDVFGWSVSIAGDYVILGAFLDDDNGEDSGSAYIFKREGSTWTQQEKLVANDGAQRDYFGHSVSIAGDYVIVGAPNDGDLGSHSGSAYIFKREGETWTQQTKLLASDGQGGAPFGDNFGSSVSISGDYAIIGAPGPNNDSGFLLGAPGSAYIFRRDSITWIEQTKLLASDGAEDDRFGGSVSIAGDYVILGAVQDDDNGEDSGSAYIFQRNGSSWTQKTKLIASDGAVRHVFGWSVSIGADKAIVGAFQDNERGDFAGAAYVYHGFSTVVGVDEQKPKAPTKFTLEQNYPNPFNPTTEIIYHLEVMIDVNLTIYNQLGQAIKELVHGRQPPGAYRVQWNGRDSSGQPLSSGVYLYRFQAGPFVQSRKMVLLR